MYYGLREQHDIALNRWYKRHSRSSPHHVL